MGRHPYRVREIAQQSGLSEATVDRALHDRPGVRASTVAEVRQAIADLDRQATQLRLVGRTFLLDLVMQAPARFSTAMRTALESELPALRPTNVRVRFHLGEEADPVAMVGMLERVARKGSHGVLLKAPNHPEVAGAVDRLHEQGIPVVTLVTDVPDSRRTAYVGIDNRAAGATAAYLIAHWGGASGPVLVTLSRTEFRGEEERVRGFRETLQTLRPERRVVEVTDTDGLDQSLLGAVSDALSRTPAIDAVYSCGGGNTATLAAFAASGTGCRAFVAHDLDEDNVRLLRTRQISAVLHHDLRGDARRACRMLLQAHGALPGHPHSVPSQVQVVMPFNEPGRLRP